jgi:2'-5' RNA ligase
MSFDTVKVFLLPSEPAYSYIQKLKRQLKEQIGNYFYWDYEPHISLLYIKIEEGHIEQLSQLVAETVENITPFDISFNKITAPGRGLIFVDVEKSLPLRALTNSLHQAFKDYLAKTKPQHEDFEKYLRHHVTIGNYIKGDKYEKAIKFTSAVQAPEAFECRRIVVYKEDPESRKNILIKEVAV